MIIKEFYKFRKTQNYKCVTIRCPSCLVEYDNFWQNAKKRNHWLCKKCFCKSEEFLAPRRGKSPVNKQIRCLIPCEWCGNVLERTRRQLSLHQHVWCNTSCQNKWQNKLTNFNKGKNNPAYQHGQRVNGKKPEYGDGFNKELKREIKTRDGFRCQMCMKKCSGKLNGILDVHHIDENKYNNDPDNLISVCKKCHKIIHWRNSRMGYSNQKAS